MRIIQLIVTCINLQIALSYTWSYKDWYQKVWIKWKKAGYVAEKKFKCETKQAFGQKGVINSPNHPLHYPSNADCTWIIETPKEYTEIRIKMVQFNVENVRWSKLCIKDSLEIFQHTNDERQKKGRYCGKQAGKQLTVYGNKAEFKFKTNGYRTKRGFRIEWEAVKGCGGLIQNTQDGQISIPKSETTEKYFYCQWKIRAPINHDKIVLKINQLQLPSNRNDNCRKTSIQIIDENDQIIAQYCNSLDATTKTIQVSGKSVRVRVKINKKTKRTSFKASWKSSAKTPAGGKCGIVGNIGGDNNIHHRARRLVGGVPAERGQWPWIVQVRTTVMSVYYTTQTVTCGGVLISPSHIITAAHCVHRTKEQVLQHEVLIGSISEDHTEQRVLNIEPSEITVHPKFKIDANTGKPRHDIAVIRLSKKIDVGRNIQPICLPTKSDIKHKNCKFAGWGKTSENSLHSSHLNSIQARLWGHCDNSPSIICATYDGKQAGACQGDSGSPLVCTRSNGSRYLVGILSYGGRKCPSLVDGHIDVKFYIDWIDNVVQNSNYDNNS